MNPLWLIVVIVLGAVVGLAMWISRAKPRTKLSPQPFPTGSPTTGQPAAEASPAASEEQQKQNTTAVAAWWWLQHHPTAKDVPPDEPKA